MRVITSDGEGGKCMMRIVDPMGVGVVSVSYRSKAVCITEIKIVTIHQNDTRCAMFVDLQRLQLKFFPQKLLLLHYYNVV